MMTEQKEEVASNLLLNFLWIVFASLLISLLVNEAGRVLGRGFADGLIEKGVVKVEGKQNAERQ